MQPQTQISNSSNNCLSSPNLQVLINHSVLLLWLSLKKKRKKKRLRASFNIGILLLLKIQGACWFLIDSYFFRSTQYFLCLSEKLLSDRLPTKSCFISFSLSCNDDFYIVFPKDPGSVKWLKNIQPPHSTIGNGQRGQRCPHLTIPCTCTNLYTPKKRDF